MTFAFECFCRHSNSIWLQCLLKCHRIKTRFSFVGIVCATQKRPKISLFIKWQIKSYQFVSLCAIKYSWLPFHRKFVWVVLESETKFELVFILGHSLVFFPFSLKFHLLHHYSFNGQNYFAVAFFFGPPQRKLVSTVRNLDEFIVTGKCLRLRF